MQFGKQALALALLVSPAFAVDSAVLNMVPPDTKSLAGINVNRTTASQFGQFILSRMQTSDQHFQDFINNTGFDPRRDLRELVAAQTDPAKKHSGLVIAQGIFNVPKLVAAAQAHGATLTSYQGVQVIAGPQADAGWVAFLDGRTALAGNPDLVRQAIDRRSGSGSQLDAKLAAKVTDVSNRYDVWAVSNVPVTGLNAKIPDDQMNGIINSDVFQSIEQASGGVIFGPSLQISGEAVTRSEKDATALADVLRFLTSLVQGRAQGAPFLPFLNNLELTSSANVMRVSLTVPEAEIEKLFLEKKPRTAKVQKVSAPRLVR